MIIEENENWETLCSHNKFTRNNESVDQWISNKHLENFWGLIKQSKGIRNRRTMILERIATFSKILNFNYKNFN